MVISRIPGNSHPKKPFYCFKSRQRTFANIYIQHHDKMSHVLPIAIKIAEQMLGPLTPAFIEDELGRDTRFWGLGGGIVEDEDDVVELSIELCDNFIK